LSPAARTAHGPRLLLAADAAYDEPSVLHVAGLPAQAAVTVEVCAADDSGVPRRAGHQLLSNAKGEVELLLPALLHALAPDDPTAFLESIPNQPQRAAKFVHRSLRPLSLSVDVRAAASGALHTVQRRHLLRQGIRRETVNEGDDLRGELFWPEHGAPRAGVLLLAGSGGGLDLAAAAVLAREGIATFTQALFGHADLPPSMVDLPVERVERGLAWFAGRLGHNRIVLRGISKGSEMAVRAALRAPDHVAGLVLWVPSPMTTTGRGEQPGARALLTEGGQPVPHGVPPHEPDFDATAWTASRPYRLAPVFERMWRDPANAAFLHPVHLLRCPTLVMSGSDDGIWPSALAGEMLIAAHRLRAASAPMEHQQHPNAGHGFNLPCTAEGLSHRTWHPKQQLWLDVGGTPQGNGAAADTAWQQLLGFVQRCTG
jgi:dienelactone hydrolase